MSEIDRFAVGDATVFVAKTLDQERQYVAAAVAEAGYVTHPISTIRDAGSKLSVKSPACLVTDVPCVRRDAPDLLEQLPLDSATDLTELSKANVKSPTLVLSSALLKDMKSAMDKGGVHLITAPYSQQELLDAIRQALASDIYYRELRADQALVSDLIHGLTKRECEIMMLIYAGKPNKAIAQQAGVSVRTVEDTRARIFRKLGVDSAVGLARKLALADIQPDAGCEFDQTHPPSEDSP